MAIINRIGMIQVVLVDQNDQVKGFKEKFACHKIPVPLHRTISIVIFNQDKTEMLITKRSTKKPTWPLVWSNAVCSHPYPGENYQKAAERRLYEELGFETPLRPVFKFNYRAEMANRVWGECELDAVFVGKYDGRPIHPNPDEVAGYKWLKTEELKKDLKKNPGKYTPWFGAILRRLKV